jgi:hypothetical protein
VAEAIVKIIFNNVPIDIFHIFNDNAVEFSKILTDISVLKDNEFLQRMMMDMRKPDMQKYLIHIINDITKGKEAYKSKITVDNKITLDVLNSLGFEWPKIDNRYIEHFLNTIS